MATATLPTLHDGADHFLLSADGAILVRFSEVGNHQVLMTRFAIVDGNWEPQSGGFNWRGPARERYQALLNHGYRKVA